MSSSDARADLSAVSGLQSRQIEWLWPGWFALGKPALLDGDPGLGKSLLALDLCARLSTGRPFPNAASAAPPGCAIVLNGEDGGEDTIKPRLASLDADLDRVFVLRPHQAAGPPLLFPAGLDRLARAVRKVRARLVVIDPIMAYLDPNIAASSDQGARRALLPLAQLADAQHCCLLLIRHLTKSAGPRALYRGGGSIGLIGACRSGCLVAPDPTDPRRRVLAQVKNNLAPLQPSLGYELVSRDHAPPALSWLGPSRWGADELLAWQRPPTRITPRDRAREFLLTFLQAGPRTSRDIWTAALDLHLTEPTLRRAKSDLAIRSRRVWAAGRRLSYWMLPGQRLPAEPAAPAPPSGTDEDAGDLEPWLSPLRQQYPPLTPLDDL
jgi:hypothetical protein